MRFKRGDNVAVVCVPGVSKKVQPTVLVGHRAVMICSGLTDDECDLLKLGLAAQLERDPDLADMEAGHIAADVDLPPRDGRAVHAKPLEVA